MLVLEPPVGTVSRSSQEKMNTSFFCQKIHFDQSRSVLSRNCVSLPTCSCQENQWKKSQAFKENFYIFILK